MVCWLCFHRYGMLLGSRQEAKQGRAAGHCRKEDSAPTHTFHPFIPTNTLRKKERQTEKRGKAPLNLCRNIYNLKYCQFLFIKGKEVGRVGQRAWENCYNSACIKKDNQGGNVKSDPFPFSEEQIWIGCSSTQGCQAGGSWYTIILWSQKQKCGSNQNQNQKVALTHLCIIEIVLAHIETSSIFLYISHERVCTYGI